MKKTLFTLLFGFSFMLTVYCQPFEFAVIGDMPYHPDDTPKFEHLIDEINGETELSWVLHTGDVKSGGSPCSDEFLQSRLNLYQRFALPFILTPGDNEWTDCHRPLCGGYDPLERLEAFRSLYYQNPLQSLGKRTIPLNSQHSNPGYEKYVENQRWEKNGVLFATMHLVGSLNGMAPFEGRDARDDQEAQQRLQAAVSWLKESFELANTQQHIGVFLMIHANPGFDRRADSAMQVGFGPFLDALEQEVIRFKKPVLLAHGDSHYFRYDKPLLHSRSYRRIENFTRLEAFGARDIHWVRVQVDAEDPNVFAIRQELIPANLEAHE